MSIALAIYVIAGPLAWLGVVVAARAGAKRMNRIRDEPANLPDPSPSLSIVVPARDEAGGIEDCVKRILAQDYPNARLSVIDDRSSDGTGERLDAMAKDDPRLDVTHVTELPAGWLGKCHALDVGTRGLTSDWLLFVDSDVGLTPDAARQAVAAAEHRQYDALSLMPKLIAPTFWERLLLPPLALTWAATFQISLTNDDSRKRHALANGQFFLIRRAWYEKVGGHAAVKDRIVEDVAMMRLLKAQGARTRLMAGQHLARTRMHPDLRRMFHGWARIFAGSSGRSIAPILVAWLFIATTGLSLVAAAAVAIATRDWRWFVAFDIHALLAVGFAIWTYRTAGQPAGLVALLPLAWSMVLAILAYAIRVCASGKVGWRGNAVAVNRD